MSIPDHYIPGVCNIGPAEIRLRRRSGWGGLAVTAVAAVLLAGLHARPGWRLLLFFPAAAAASGFLQSALHFCLGFGLKAVFNFGDPGKVDGVAQAQFRAMDRRRALRILGYSVLAGAAVALAAYGIG